MANELLDIRDSNRLVNTGESKFRHISVYVCGPPQSGKSSFCQSLLKYFDHRNLDLHVMTSTARVINVTRVKDQDGSIIKLWDFAGMSEYFVNHDIFTAKGSPVFIVMIDCRSSKAVCMEKTRYWLQYIVSQTASSSKPRVFVIAAHADEAAAEDEDGYSIETTLSIISMTLFPEYTDVLHFVSESIVIAKGTELASPGVQYVCEQLQSILCEPAKNSSDSAPIICTDILDVLDDFISTKGTRYMSWLDYCDKMKKVTDDVSLLALATKRLHGLGEVFFDPSRLSGIVVTDMVWFYNDVLGWLFTPPKLLPANVQASMSMFRVLAENGPVRKQEIPNSRVFQSLGIEMIDVLEAFEICYGFEQAGQKYYIFPSMLRTQPLRSLWLVQEMFTIHMGLKFVCSKRTMMIPPGFFERLQVRIRLDIGPKFTTTATQADSIWRLGTICKLNNAIGLVRLAPDHQSLFVHVRGDSESSIEVRALMQRIVKVIQYKSSRYPRLNFNVEHCIASDLKTNALEPQTLPQAAVQTARERGTKTVFSLDGTVEAVSRLLAFDTESK